MRGKIDTHAVKAGVDLLVLLGSYTTLKRIASTGGGEWLGGCPLCPDHGHKRLHVQPHQKPWGIWMCHHCTDSKWKDPLELARRLWPNLSFPARCERLMGGSVPITSAPLTTQPACVPLAQPPSPAWQEAAGRVVEECQATLWKPAFHRVMKYLQSRGLKEETIRRFRLGYCSTGSPNLYGKEMYGMYVARGVLIPWFDGADIWALKTRLLPGVPCKCQGRKTPLTSAGKCSLCDAVTKYCSVAGSRAKAIFNTDSLADHDIALFCEGEFDTLVAFQALNDVLPVASLGSATNGLPDLARWGRYFGNKKVLFLLYDQDAAGQKRAKALCDQYGRFVNVLLPPGHKDVTDFFLAGGNLWEVLSPYLNRHDPLEGDWKTLFHLLEKNNE